MKVKVLFHNHLPVNQVFIWHPYDALKSMASAPFWTAAAELRPACRAAFHHELLFRPSSCVCFGALSSQTRAEQVVTDTRTDVIDLLARCDDGLDSFEPEVKADDQSRPRRQAIHKQAPTHFGFRVIRGRRQQRGFWQRSPALWWSLLLSVFASGLLIGTTLARPARPSAEPVPGSAVARLEPAPPTPVATPTAVVRDERGTAGSEVTPAVDTGANRNRAVARDSPRPRAAVPLHRGTLIVTSTPQGAAVFINDQYAGQTPLTIRRMPAGSRAVRVALDGFASWSRGVQVVADQTTTVSAKLNQIDPAE